ncbi:hypothetical protein AAVH_38953 [Aphelenchoides avenae]|nr:hypothetical protein AAVH_38953 [Aphelenchus avenae]
MLFLDLDEATLKFGTVLPIASNCYEDILPTLRQMSGSLHAMRQFVSRITVYFVEAVIRNECRKLDDDLAAAANVHEIQRMHSTHLESIRHACFLTEQGDALSDVLRSITRLIRNYVSAIAKFFATWDDEAVRDWELQQKCFDGAAPVDPTAVEAVLGPARSEFCQLVMDAYAHEVEEFTEQFLVEVNELRDSLEKLLRQPNCSGYSHLLLTCIRSLYT